MNGRDHAARPAGLSGSIQIRRVMASFRDDEKESVWLRWGGRTGRLLLLLALLTGIVGRGAVTPAIFFGMSTMVALAAAIGSLWPPMDRAARRSFDRALVLGGLAFAYCWFQTWNLPGDPWAHPLWGKASTLFDGLAPSISVDPSVTSAAAYSLLLPFLVYAACLALFPGDDGAMKLMRWLAGMGAAFAVFGLVQLLAFPDSLLIWQKTAYRDSLTGTFVNRNTAGTLLGIASLSFLTLLIWNMRKVREWSSLFVAIVDPNVEVRLPWRAILAAVLLVIVLLALVLTKSRGAIGATAIAYLAVLPGLALSAFRHRRQNGRATVAKGGIVRAVLVALVALVAIGCTVWLFGGLAIHRMEVRGFDAIRLCVYSASLDAIGENWRFGTGFGTFSTVFPIYRLPDCGFPKDVFHRAHNVYLEGMLGLGLPFLGLVVALYLHIGSILARGVRTRRRFRFVPIIGIGAVILSSLHSLVDFSVEVPGMAAYMAAFLAAVTTLSLGGFRSDRTAYEDPTA